MFESDSVISPLLSLEFDMFITSDAVYAHGRYTFCTTNAHRYEKRSYLVIFCGVVLIKSSLLSGSIIFFHIKIRINTAQFLA